MKLGGHFIPFNHLTTVHSVYLARYQIREREKPFIFLKTKQQMGMGWGHNGLVTSLVSMRSIWRDYYCPVHLEAHSPLPNLSIT